MKSIGLVGGMSWESTALYYQIINRAVAQRRGGLHSARMHVASLDFHEIAAAQTAGAWDALARTLSEAALGLQRAGADCILICTNTMHRIAPQVQSTIDVPLLHIADITAQAVVRAGCRKVALLGTRYTMEQSFYVGRLAEHGVACVIPSEPDRAEVHRVIFDELCQGDVNAESRQALRRIIERQTDRGADGVVLACTELPLTLSQHDVAVPLFDTTALHARAAIDFALGPP